MAQLANQMSTVVWRDTSKHNQPDYVVPVHTEAYEKWKRDHDAVSLLDVVDGDEIFVSRNGAQGRLDRPSSQQLQDSFGESSREACIHAVLHHGQEHRLKHGNEIIPNDRTSFRYGPR